MEDTSPQNLMSTGSPLALRTRRSLLAGAAAALGAVVAQALGRPLPAAAASVQLGQTNTSNNPTTFRNPRASSTAKAVIGATTYTGGAASSAGVQGSSAGTNGTGVTGIANRGQNAFGVWGRSTNGVGVTGQGRIGVYGAGPTGVRGYDAALENIGELGLAWTGVSGYAAADGGFGVSGEAYTSDLEVPVGVYGASSASGWAGWFDGDVFIGGGLYSPEATAFMIDHPSDPEGRLLAHAAIASPERLAVYSGNVRTGDDGRAVVRLPGYFGRLNDEVRYQLTVIGTMAQAVVADPVADNRFTIETDKPNVRVSWQVTGVRADAAARRRPFDAERRKRGPQQGRFVDPVAAGAAAGATLLGRRGPGRTSRRVARSQVVTKPSE